MNILSLSRYEGLYFLLLEHGDPLKEKAAVLKKRQEEGTADQDFIVLMLETCISELKDASDTKRALQDSLKHMQGNLSDTELHVSMAKAAGVL